MDRKAAEKHLEKIGQEVPEQLSKGILLIVFGALEHFYVDDNFKCPCFNLSTITATNDENCYNARVYASLFMALTTLGAGILGILSLAAIKFEISRRKKSKHLKPERSSAYLGTSFSNPGRDRNVAEQQEEQGQSSSAGSPQDGNQAAVQGSGDDIEEEQENQGPSNNNASQRDENQADSELYIYYSFRAKECSKKLLEGFVISLAWLCLLLIDGDYFACAQKCRPYGNATCSAIRGLPNDELPFTREFANTRRLSQYIGIGLSLAVIALVAFVKFCFKGCCGCCESQPPECCRCCNIVCKYNDKLKIGKKERNVEDVLSGIGAIAKDIVQKEITKLQRRNNNEIDVELAAKTESKDETHKLIKVKSDKGPRRKI